MMHEAGRAAAATAAACQVCDGPCHPFVEHRGFTFQRCSRCGFCFLYPPPDDAELAVRYADSKAAATSAYFAKIPSKMRRARGRARRLAAWLPGGASNKRFLDVGCSGGFVTEAARQQGFIASGLDPDAEAVAYARKHYPANSFHLGMVEDFAPACGEQFDLVYCSEVLEHVSDVNRFVAALRLLTAPGGFLYLTTPDIGHWRRPRDPRRWDVFTPPHHCVFFTLDSMRRLLDRHGFAIERRNWAFKPGMKVLARRLG